MKNAKKINFFMIIVVLLQLALGVTLIFCSLYLDENIYIALEGFFFHFLHVPGGVLIIMVLHYLLFYKYKTSGNFIFTGVLCCFIIANTGECLFLFIDKFPDGWTGYIIWFVLCEVAVSAVLAVFHLFFAAGSGKIKEKTSTKS